MRIIAQTEKNEIATVFIVETNIGKRVECVESIQPPLNRQQKWTLIISTLYGCPVGCGFCDAGGFFHGRVSKEDMLGQIFLMTDRYFPSRRIDIDKFKIQFARMGEPSLNPDVLHVLQELPIEFHAPGLLPSLSSVAPDTSAASVFFDRLLEIKRRLYPLNFQLQFSLHSTNTNQRDLLIPIKKWSFHKIAEYGESFAGNEGRKVTLNFALNRDMIVDSEAIKYIFNPNYFFIKITPVNPTYKATFNNINTLHDADYYREKADEFRETGYDTIVSIGELEENFIGSNCGQYLAATERADKILTDGYARKIIAAGV